MSVMLFILFWFVETMYRLPCPSPFLLLIPIQQATRLCNRREDLVSLLLGGDPSPRYFTHLALRVWVSSWLHIRDTWEVSNAGVSGPHPWKLISFVQV